MLEKIISLFSEDPSANEKAVTIADLLNALFAYILSFMGVEAE